MNFTKEVKNTSNLIKQRKNRENSFLVQSKILQTSLQEEINFLKDGPNFSVSKISMFWSDENNQIKKNNQMWAGSFF